MSGELQRLDDQNGELAERVEPNTANPIAVLLKGVTETGLTADSAAAIERLAALYERTEAAKAEREYARAFAALQSETVTVNPNRVIPDNNGGTRSQFADFPEIMGMVRPILARHGFSVRFNARYDFTTKPLMVAECYLRHTSGPEVKTEFAVRVGSGPPKASEAQADGAAMTYAKRYALCNALNIVVGEVDTDARNEGETIDPGTAADIERRVRATGGDVTRFLAFAGAASFAEIRTGRLASVLQAVAEKEREKPAATEPPPGFDDANDWSERMLLGMGERWECSPSQANAAMNDLLRRGKYAKVGDVPIAARVKAWEALASGKLDAHRPKAE